MNENSKQIKIKIEGINEISLYELNGLLWIISQPEEKLDKVKPYDNNFDSINLNYYLADPLAHQIFIKQIRPGCIEILAHLPAFLDIISLLFEVEIPQKYAENPEVYNAKLKEIWENVIKSFIFNNRSKDYHNNSSEGGEKDISVKIEKSEPEK